MQPRGGSPARDPGGGLLGYFLLPVMPAVSEHRVGLLFLIVRHRGIQRSKRRSESLDTIRMSLGDIPIGIQVIDSVRAVNQCFPLVDGFIGFNGTMTHRLCYRGPLGFLGRSDLELRMQILD